MTVKPYIYVVNDTDNLNVNYRSSLISSLKLEGFRTNSLGLFDRNYQNLKHIFQILSSKRVLIVSSNLRTNIVMLFLWHVRGLVILNGMGRLRKKKLARYFIVTLVWVNTRKKIAVQNYADFRYLRRFTRSSLISWVPGSGGTVRNHGIGSAKVAVQRDAKLFLVSASLINFLRNVPGPHKISVMGCTQLSSELSLESNYHDIRCMGRVAQEDIFQHGRIFLQPAGYGEGLPHSLVDAIVSNMEVWIDRRMYLQTGLWKMGFELIEITGHWGRITCLNPSSRTQLLRSNTDRLYLGMLGSSIRYDRIT